MLTTEAKQRAVIAFQKSRSSCNISALVLLFGVVIAFQKSRSSCNAWQGGLRVAAVMAFQKSQSNIAVSSKIASISNHPQSPTPFGFRALV